MIDFWSWILGKSFVYRVLEISLIRFHFLSMWDVFWNLFTCMLKQLIYANEDEKLATSSDRGRISSTCLESQRMLQLSSLGFPRLFRTRYGQSQVYCMCGFRLTIKNPTWLTSCSTEFHYPLTGVISWWFSFLCAGKGRGQPLI